jgi:uncharacterized phosphosugar-binding protein
MSDVGDPVIQYLEHARSLIDRVLTTQLAQIERAGDLVADAIAADALVHVFGSGHSHMLAEELFYRAGGLAAVDPILRDELMLHHSAVTSTVLERETGRGIAIFETLTVAPCDVLIVASNSGGNRVAVELAEAAHAVGMPVIAILSVNHANSPQSLYGDGGPLLRIADVVIDNGGVPGDAAVTIPGLPQPVGPTSTVVGAAIVNAIAVRAVAQATAADVTPAVFHSSNMAGGDARNREVFERYQPRVRSL